VSTVGDALLAYEAALEEAGTGSLKERYAGEKVLRILVARQAVDALLRRSFANGISVPTTLLEKLTNLDDQLRSQAVPIESQIGEALLVNWRETLGSSSNRWWWHLDARVAANRKRNALFALTVGLSLTISLTLTTEITTRLLSAGPDFLSVLNLVVQGILAVIAGTAFLGAGRRSIEALFQRLGLKRQFRDPAKAVLAVAVLLFVLVLRSRLPDLARLYNEAGVAEWSTGRATSAIADYKRAISLDPDFPQAHYNLGNAYEELLQEEDAISEYRSAIILDPEMYAAYNNLARLYIAQQAPGSALSLLDPALNKRIAAPEVVRYALLKNRAWANLELNYLYLAQEDVNEALRLRPNGAAAHCLQAQLLEKVHGVETPQQEITSEWEACIRYSTVDEVKPEAIWVNLAAERLSGEPQE
jgi:tetratricopeptide (TPR) repeat protein